MLFFIKAYRNLLQVSVLILAILMTTLLSAYSGQELATLARLEREINSLYALIAEAESYQSEKERVQVDYHTMRYELQQIQQGIVEILSVTTIQPRVIESITGDFIKR